MPNKLASEKSPYLLQHADNPVDWHPWAREAFEKAKTEDKPVFLSVGYSTCHWCHVMEHESFSDAEVAALLNRVCVPVKVDREERPDIDNLYMEVCQRMTGGGGWPLTVLLTPDQKPFFAGTYFPKRTRLGRTGLIELLEGVEETWKSRRDEITRSAEGVMIAIGAAATPAPAAPEEPDEALLRQAYTHFAEKFDDKHGGFGTAPKFPTPHQLSFLLRFWKRSQEEKALQMTEQTLQSMRRGGIFDHLGFGFHRYSTDGAWLVPHFEKMLYDQAMLVIAYLEAYQATGNHGYADTAREVFTYVERELTSPEGGFYSAEDADSEGEEGKAYLWTPEEMAAALSEREAELAMKAFNVRPGGNFVDPLTGERPGPSILHRLETDEALAADLGMPAASLKDELAKIRKKLLGVRRQRVQPFKDDKILTDWNGLMVVALAKGAQVLGEPHYVETAKKAMDFILNTVRNSENRLAKRFCQGEAGLPAFVDDYAFIIWALIELYEATFDPSHVEAALELNGHLLKWFWDEENGGFFFTSDPPDEGEGLISRRQELYDGALPSGNSVAALNLLRLSRITGDTDFENKAWVLIRRFAHDIKAMPWAYTQLLMALDYALGVSYEIVVVGALGDKDTKLMLKDLQRVFAPNKVIVHRPLDESRAVIEKISPYISEFRGPKDRTTVYVCQDFSCQEPTTDRRRVLESLGFTKQELL